MTQLKSFLTFYCLFLSKSLWIKHVYWGLEERCNEMWSLSSFFENVQYTKYGKSLFEINLFPCNQVLGYM